jgi:hypothetical protein
MAALGIPIDQACALATNGVTAAKMAEYQATMIANGMDKAEIATRMAQIAALFGLTTAEGVSTASKGANIAATIG